MTPRQLALFTPNLDFKYTIVSSFSRFDEELYKIKIYNGDVIHTILAADYNRMTDSMASQMEYCCYKGQILWRKYQKDSLKHRIILTRLIKVLAFEIPGSYTVEISLPEIFYINEPDVETRETLALHYVVQPELDIIEKKVSSK